jgi:UDP-hydrolysing UDP-N-acetyl-D-glucosamine 2-epimerase
MWMARRKILTFVGSRANYSSIKSVMTAIVHHPNLELMSVVGASALLDRFGRVVDLIRRDGFEVHAKFHMIIEGEDPTTMAKSTGLGLIEMATILDNLRPDFVLVVGDRFEIASVALAAAYMNIPIAHTMGGEVTGTIDESIRHAVTKLAHIHFPANADAAARILRMGEPEANIFQVGCPRIDLVADVLANGELEPNFFKDYRGVGPTLDLSGPFLLASQHPVTTEYGQARHQIEETLWALASLHMPTIMLWPNVDAGSDEVAKGIRTFRERQAPDWLHLFINLPTEVYIRLMARTACLIGNSSSAIREGAFIGVPAVNVGSRQQARQRGSNVVDVPHDRAMIAAAITEQVRHGRFPREGIYGDGCAGQRIADVLSRVEVQIQKRLAY